MAPPKGSQFWKRRSKHGRDYLFATPELLWAEAAKYFDWCDKNPWFTHEQVKNPPRPFKDPNTGEYVFPDPIVSIPTARPYTLQGLCLYLNCGSRYFNNFEKGLEGKDDALSAQFHEVVERIRETIYTQKFEGAAVGAFNANLISRELGLADKREEDVRVWSVTMKTDATAGN